MSHSLRQLGDTGINVSAIGLGAMPLSLKDRPSKAQALQVFKTFIEAGGNFIDTANVYCRNENEIGHNESLVYNCLKDLGCNDVYIATKGGLRMQGDSWTVDASPAWLRMSCENSLRNLNTHSIFLYQLHAPDPDIDILESVGELMRMQTEGLIQHIGLSNVTRKQLRRVIEMTSILSVQNRCNVFHCEDIEKGLVRMCHDNHVLYISHSPVGGHYNHATQMSNKLLSRLADKHASTPYCIALAWLLHQGENILPIPGASKPASIENSLTAMDITLDEEDLEKLGRLKL